MFIDKDSIKIDGISMGQYLLEAQYQYNKIWSSDSGRNLAGTQSGTLLGIFPKIVLTFRKLTKDELEIIVPILDEAIQQFNYYDPYKKASVTMTTYTGDYSVVNKSIIDSNRKNDSFTCSFISTKKRV